MLPRATAAQASYADGDAVRRALEGLATVLMVSAGETERRVDEHRAFVDAAAAAGVRHLIYISFYGASADATFTLARDHHLTEQYIEQSGMAWTFLRDNLYADFFPMMVGDDGVIRGPADDGRVAADRRARDQRALGGLPPTPPAGPAAPRAHAGTSRGPRRPGQARRRCCAGSSGRRRCAGPAGPSRRGT